jgi:hypothetical protein
MKLKCYPVLFALLLTVIFAACGGKQQKEESAEPTVEEADPTCVEEGWAQPPEGIGDTPPSRFPSPDTLKPFEHAGSNEDSSSTAHSPSDNAGQPEASETDTNNESDTEGARQ